MAKSSQEVEPLLELKDQPGPTAAAPAALCSSPSLHTRVFNLPASPSASGLRPEAQQG